LVFFHGRPNKYVYLEQTLLYEYISTTNTSQWQSYFSEVKSKTSWSKIIFCIFSGVFVFIGVKRNVDFNGTKIGCISFFLKKKKDILEVSCDLPFTVDWVMWTEVQAKQQHEQTQHNTLLQKTLQTRSSNCSEPRKLQQKTILLLMSHQLLVHHVLYSN